MADTLRPPTLLLGAVCLWALSLLALALTGLGSRFPAGSDDVKPPPLPAVSLTRGQSRLGPMANYHEVGERSLMTADRRPAPMLAPDGQAGASELDVMLTSVLITPNLKLAILTNNKDATARSVRVGEVLQGSSWRLIQLEPRRAVVEGPSGQRVLDLRVFDGKGGQAPTQVAASAPAGAAPQDNSEQGEQAAQVVQGAQPQPNVPSPPRVQAPPNVQTAPDIAAQPSTPASQDQQIEAIRRRIEARRAQMRAEAAAASANEK